jgi:predicted Zn-ribbon and HTH transcriptional regulator
MSTLCIGTDVGSRYIRMGFLEMLIYHSSLVKHEITDWTWEHGFCQGQGTKKQKRKQKPTTKKNKNGKFHIDTFLVPMKKKGTLMKHPRTHIVGMYRSRFRCRKEKDQTKEESSSSTTIYTNRSNRYVIDRMLDVGKKKWNTTARVTYEDSLKEMETLQTQIIPPGISYFVTMSRKNKRLKTLREVANAYERNEFDHHWHVMTNQLYQKSDNHVGRLILSNRIMGRPTESFFMDPDSCTSCMIFFVFNHVTNVHVCPKCGLTKDVLFISEDKSQDVLVTKDPNIGSTDTVKPPSEYHYIRGPLYRRYLYQFSSEAPVVPIGVMRVLYKYLSNVHLQNSVRCRPTPVANILRNHGFAKWANYSVRITKLFNGEPVPMIPVELLDRLVRRFDLIFQEASLRKKKLPSFEFITNILLRVEGREDLSQSFGLHKTRNVLRRIFKELCEVIHGVSATTQEFVWEPLPEF